MNKPFPRHTLAAAILTVSAVPAFAQQTLEEVSVTAQKRESNLQSTAMAVTALTGDAMSEAGVDDMTSLETRVPGMSMGTFNLGQPQIYIRGIGSNADGASADNSVVVFLDEVYIGRASGSALSLYDVERVEVLRGPQGTLYGKNVVGGAISVISKKPTEEFYTRGELTTGNYNLVTAKTAISGPLTDNLFGKIALSSSDRDGFMESANPAAEGMQLNDKDSLNFRGQLRYVPTDTLELNLTADWSKDRNAGTGRIHTPGTTVYAALKAIAPQVADNDELSWADDDGFQHRDVSGVTGRVDWDLAAGTVTSITAYRETDYRMQEDGFNIDVSVIGIDSLSMIDETADQFSQELRFTSETIGAWNWIAGLYYLQEDIYRDESTSSMFGPFSSDIASLQWNTTESYAVFGEVNYYLSDAMKLAVGARYTTETKESRQIRTDSLDPTTNYDVTAEADFSALTPRIVLDYQATENTFVYGSVSKGFKSGGFAGTSETAEAASTPFEEEIAITYELGMKSELLDRSLRLNMALFNTDYDDLQVLEYVTVDVEALEGYFLTDNAASATSRGLELEWLYYPEALSGLEISGSYAWLDATYDDYEPDPAVAGNRLRNAPEQSYNVALGYEFNLGSAGYLKARYEYRYKGDSFQDPQNYVLSSIPEYAVSNARLSYMPASDTWTLSAWVDNIADEDYLVHNFPIGLSETGGMAAPATPGNPRTYGLTFAWDY
ncbi:TonB-dependent receptor [Microbulbifer bruguierae]|uniref:TonB-dependent receptor n=1 Tax=Microbulbifer bruguierae TaxID=3029061 RepID=A0ABY8NA59_9GAMM|nr:TonB-dependent receptor [Microbulbifer bruguierae]WGL15795.1 TonB-dependent receptor [Microbulbifer bruguierae]